LKLGEVRGQKQPFKKFQRALLHNSWQINLAIELTPDDFIEFKKPKKRANCHTMSQWKLCSHLQM